jgi:hypothetical protein
MDVSRILEELKAERQQIEEAIVSLERLAHGRGRRRGRPPAWMSEAKRRDTAEGQVHAAEPAAAAKIAVA